MTITAFLPPISQVTLAPRRAAFTYSSWPTRFEPVNEMARSSGAATIASPTSAPLPTTMLKTPGGIPASS